MSRSRWHPFSCRVCGRTAHEVGHISATGLCRDHSLEREKANFDAMKSQRGPYAKWWAFRMAQSVGWAPLDETVSRP